MLMLFDDENDVGVLMSGRTGVIVIYFKVEKGITKDDYLNK